MHTHEYESSCCTDCLMFIANGEPPLVDPATGADWTDDEAAAWVAAWHERNAGIYWVPSSWPGTDWTDEDRYYGIDSEGHFFSRYGCNLCGSSLGGDRYPVTGFSR